MESPKRKYWFVFMATILTLVQSAPAEEVFEIDNSHSAVLFSVSHFNIGYIYGRFNTCSGKITIDKETPENSSFQFAIETKSIDTNDIARDNHLRGGDFFNVQAHPNIEFKSTSVKVSGGNYRVVGKIKIREVEQEVSIPFQLLGVGKGPFGNTRMGMLAKFSVKRSDFGMTEMLESIGDDVAITFSLQGILK